MTPTRFVGMLDNFLHYFEQATHQLTEAGLLAQPTDELTRDLHLRLQSYAWTVQSRALLREAGAATTHQQATELHLRLSVVEMLVALRAGLPHQAEPAPPADSPAPTPDLHRRLAAAEARLFHLYGVAPLN